MENRFEKATRKLKELDKEYVQIQEDGKEINEELAQMIADTTEKKYKCERCGFIVKKKTNYSGKVYGPPCRICPTELHHKGPIKTHTVWICIEPKNL